MWISTDCEKGYWWMISMYCKIIRCKSDGQQNLSAEIVDRLRVHDLQLTHPADGLPGQRSLPRLAYSNNRTSQSAKNDALRATKNERRHAWQQQAATLHSPARIASDVSVEPSFQLHQISIQCCTRRGEDCVLVSKDLTHEPCANLDLCHRTFQPIMSCVNQLLGQLLTPRDTWRSELTAFGVSTMDPIHRHVHPCYKCLSKMCPNLPMSYSLHSIPPCIV